MAVSREDLMRIKRELAEKSAKAFAADLVRWLRTGSGAIPFEGADGKKDELFYRLTEGEKKWARDAYSAAKEEEIELFSETLSQFMYWLGTKRIGCENLLWVLRKMARDGGRLGEFYSYLVQYSDETLLHKQVRLGSVVSMMRQHGETEKRYSAWFADEFRVPGEGIFDGEPPLLFSTRSAKEMKELREKADVVAIYSMFSASGSAHAGSAALGRIFDYLETGEVKALVFENRGRANRIAGLLFEAGVEDVMVSGRRLALGLKEKMSAATFLQDQPSEAPTEEEIGYAYLDYFSTHGIGESEGSQIKQLLEGGKAREALRAMGLAAIEMCRDQYLVLGEKRYAFGEEGEKMVSEFRTNAGGDENASLLRVSELVERGAFVSALERLGRIINAVENAKEAYPHLF